jgi:DNA topoisomerase-3
MGQSLSREQICKLLEAGKTDFLKGFLSHRTKKPFRARLIWNAVEGGVIFDFPEAKERASKKTAVAVSSRELEKIRRRKVFH